MPTPQRSAMSMMARAKVPARSCGLLSSETRIWPSWVVWSTAGCGEPQAALQVRHADHPHGRLLAEGNLGKPLSRHFRRKLEIALGDEGEQGLGPRRGHRADHGNALGDDARHRRIDLDRRTAAVRRREPHQRLSRLHGFAGLDQNPRDLHPLALRPDQHLLPRHQDAGDLDRVLEAGALRLHHRHRGADRIGRGLRGRCGAGDQAGRSGPGRGHGEPSHGTPPARRRPGTTFNEEALRHVPFPNAEDHGDRAGPDRAQARPATAAVATGADTSLG